MNRIERIFSLEPQVAEPDIKHIPGLDWFERVLARSIKKRREEQRAARLAEKLADAVWADLLRDAEISGGAPDRRSLAPKVTQWWGDICKVTARGAKDDDLDQRLHVLRLAEDILVKRLPTRAR